MLASTTQLNTPGIALGKLPEVHALTDVTGFGLLGHLLEICRGSAVAANVDFARLPLLPDALRFARDGHRHRRIGPQLGRLWRRCRRGYGHRQRRTRTAFRSANVRRTSRCLRSRPRRQDPCDVSGRRLRACRGHRRNCRRRAARHGPLKTGSFEAREGRQMTRRGAATIIAMMFAATPGIHPANASGEFGLYRGAGFPPHHRRMQGLPDDSPGIVVLP